MTLQDGEQGASPHVPVLLNEVLEGLTVRPGGAYIDGTTGAGGHALAVLQSADDVRLLGLDVDPMALEIASERLRPYIERGQAVLVRSNFGDARFRGRVRRSRPNRAEPDSDRAAGNRAAAGLRAGCDPGASGTNNTRRTDCSD